MRFRVPMSVMSQCLITFSLLRHEMLLVKIPKRKRTWLPSLACGLATSGMLLQLPYRLYKQVPACLKI